MIRSLPRRLANRNHPVARALLHDSPLPILLLDRAGRLAVANAAAAALLAHSAPGTPLDTLLAAEDGVEPARAAVSAALDGRATTLTCALRGADGPVEARLAMAPLRARRGRIAGAVLHLTDLAELRGLEARLAQGQKWQAIGQLAGGIAHDFNNLLAAIRGSAELLLDQGDAAAEADLRQIIDGTERGAALVGQILAFGRQQRLQPRVMAVNDGLRALAPLLRRLLGRGITVALDLADPGRHIRVDPTQFDQVIVNLAVNAREAMQGGGTLTLRAAPRVILTPEPHGAERVPPGRYVSVTIADTGAGISPEILPRIFDPFFTTRREQGGTGLGLATVDGIVRQSGGFLAVESRPGETRFELLFPRHDPAPPSSTAPASAAPPAPPAANPPVAGGRVLLIDDEEPLRRVAERALGRAGFEVTACDSAESALERLAAVPSPDIVVSDVVMPGMDGVTLAERLGTLCPRARVILVSGYTDSALRTRIEAARVGFLAKPYTLAGLIEAIRSDAAPNAPRA